jgi:hypothetical protein
VLSASRNEGRALDQQLFVSRYLVAMPALTLTGCAPIPLAHHPKALGLALFCDLSGRTLRVFLAERLRRLNLPLVDLGPESETA